MVHYLKKGYRQKNRFAVFIIIFCLVFRWHNTEVNIWICFFNIELILFKIDFKLSNVVFLRWMKKCSLHVFRPPHFNSITYIKILFIILQNFHSCFILILLPWKYCSCSYSMEILVLTSSKFLSFYNVFSTEAHPISCKCLRVVEVRMSGRGNV